MEVLGGIRKHGMVQTLGFKEFDQETLPLKSDSIKLGRVYSSHSLVH
jgi:hypothetical protein